jgi:malate dehydrogenase (oxaloacetate-decarboxylating)(NADP+)
MSEDFVDQALNYHARPRPGKLAVEVTKPTANQHDLALAYTPGVAEPVRRIAADPQAAYRYTTKGNLVAVITDGSAVLGLGNVGALAGKPVMEGKAVLFKCFGGIDVFDLEVASQDAATVIETVAQIAGGFGGINLEDIAAPRCFEVQEALQARLDIPVFHDDQDGTAIIVAAALENALTLQGKRLAEARIVCLGAGAAGVASMGLLQALGARSENILMVDRQGVIHAERDDLNPYKARFAAPHPERTLAEACAGADVFVGLSGPDLLTPAMLASLAPRPVVFALSNPDPEIRPDHVPAVRDDVILATGRSDYPNQVNNVLGFPYIFRGALDVEARAINQAMHIAAVEALSALAREPVPEAVLTAYGNRAMSFGPDYIIPTPFDPRLADRVPAAVARAAVASGVARRPAGHEPEGAPAS